MKCSQCASKMYESTTTDVNDLGSSVMIIRHVPCYKCSVCSEIFYTGVVVKEIEKIIDTLKSTSSEISIVEYSKRAA